MRPFHQSLASGVLGPRCAGCAHYARPGSTSSPCRLGPPSWTKVPNRLLTSADRAIYATVRADNACERWEARDAVAALELGRAA